MRRHVLRIAPLVAGAAAAMLAAMPGQAAATSLVYLKGSDVYLGAPDGSAERRLTTAGGFESPSQADDGTVVAATRVDADFNLGFLHRMNRLGKALAAPVRCGPDNSHTYAGPIAAEVSRDGSIAALHYFASPEDGPTAAYCPTDRDASISEFGEISDYANPSWISDGRVVLFSTSRLSNVITDGPGVPAQGGGSEPWFTDGDIRLSQGAADRALTRFAGIVRGGTEVRIYQMNGPPPAAPTAKCSFTGSANQFEHPTWSLDGRQLAWDEPDGIHIADVPTLDDCGPVTERLVIPGGRDPQWGPAAAPKNCVVPKLKGKTLSKAKSALKKADCALGKVTKKTVTKGKAGIVLSQSPKAGTVKPEGTAVKVVVSKR